MNWKEFKQKNLVYKTPLDKYKLEKKLRTITDEFNSYSDHKSRPLEGKIGDELFEIKIRLGFFDFVRPMAYGVISELENGCHIDLKLETDPLIITFAIIWLSIVFVMCLGTIIYIFITGNISVFQVIPFILLFGGFLMIRNVIEYQVEQISKIFKENIQTEVV